jgi:hypothetical protein
MDNAQCRGLGHRLHGAPACVWDCRRDGGLCGGPGGGRGGDWGRLVPGLELGLVRVWKYGADLAGAVGGTLQWLHLRQQVPRSGWWVLASILGWAVGLGLAVAVGKALGWMVAGAVGGVITGIALIWLFRLPAASDI